ncbi:MAG: capsule assembly Wzi family protein [candidate division Zixibacteria bacterium]|nr:capsule assembly Wzi family protein [candidate division Zixibacteria bacterium]
MKVTSVIVTAFILITTGINVYASLPDNPYKLTGDIPLAEDMYSGIYEAVSALQCHGYFCSLEYYDYPIKASNLRSDLQKIEKTGLSPSALKAYHYLQMRFGENNTYEGFDCGIDMYGALAINRDSSFNWGLFPRLEYNIGNFYFTSRYTIESGLTDNTRYQGKKWNGFTGYGNTVYGAYNKDKLRISFGRRRMNLGPGKTGSMMLDGNSLPYDGLSVEYYLTNNFRISSFTFVLDPFQEISGDFHERYLSGHRILYQPINSLTLGLTETVIYGGHGRNPEVYYIFPLFFLHGAQLNQGRDDNTLIEAEFRYFPGFAAEIYGQLLIDDFQVESKTLEDNEPSEYGFLIGVYKAELPVLKFLEIRTEYARVTNRTYNQPNERNRYLNRGYYMGHPLGNDGDTWLSELTFRCNDKLTAKIEYRHNRRGEGKIEAPWDTPWLLAPDYNESFPTGIVETTKDLSIRVEYMPVSSFSVLMSAWLTDVKNMNNTLNLNDDFAGVKISTGIVF